MRFSILILLVGCVGALSNCSNSNDSQFNLLSLNYDFNSSTNGWGGDFADYKVDDSVASELKVEVTTLPSAIAINQKSILLSGHNLDDELFMFIKKKITGLRPNAEYTLVFQVALASNAPGGIAMGDSVFIKVGASSIEPKKVKQDSYYRMNINKGTGYTNGQDMVTIGTIATDLPKQDYAVIQKSNSTYSPNPYISSHTNSKGELWLIVGTNSVFKGTSTVYFTSVSVVLSASL